MMTWRNARLTVSDDTAGAGGGLGHLCVQYANLMGMRVIAVDVSFI